MGVHPMPVRRYIPISSSQASEPDPKPRFIPLQLRQPDVASTQGPAASIIHPTAWRLCFPVTVDAPSLAPFLDILVLFRDRHGWWPCSKRLKSGTLAWPVSDATSIELTAEELTLLLGASISRKPSAGQGP